MNGDGNGKAPPPLRKSAATKTRAGARPPRPRRTREVITVVGARQHNLKDLTVEVPRNRITVCAGPSGSGKSSFAVDTVYTEGQRRYVESLSAYARQFLSRLQPPRVEHISGLSPAVCIEQKTATRSPRSTVGTITEIYDYMRILWARLGRPYCPSCNVPVGTQSSEEIVEKVLHLGEGRRVVLLAPIEPAAQETYARLFERQRSSGYARVRVDGEIHPLDREIPVDHRRTHRVELVVDRLVPSGRRRGRLTDSIEQALTVGEGVITVLVEEGGDRTEADSGGESTRADESARSTVREYRFSQHRSCERCGRSFDELTPHHFSFNTRMGWCETCEGLGVQRGASASTVVVHPTRSILDGAVGAWGKLKPGTLLHRFVSALADHVGFDLATPWNELDERHRRAILYGCGEEWISLDRDGEAARSGRRTMGIVPGMRFQWRGFFPAIHRATQTSWQYRKRLEDLVTEVPCDACAGGRLRAESAAVRLHGMTLPDVCRMSLDRAAAWFADLPLTKRERTVAGELLHEITSRLSFLVEVGLHYLSLDRPAATLSGGESQRIQLASQIGTGLTGVLYVLDEPTIGLHPRDNDRLIAALKRLRRLGNTLLLVEHDREIIRAADCVLDFGPGAGALGGEITAQGTPKQIETRGRSLTGKYLSGKQAIPVPAERRPVDEQTPRLTVHGAREHNLREIDVAFPLGRFVCVTGVSGSGKSTLVTEILYRALASRIHRARLVPGGHDRITGLERIDKVINVDQTPIGNSPTSNPATYTGVFDAVRELFARLPESRIRGYTANRFSFNRPGGRCEACEGMGQRCIEMHFLPDVWVTCEQCGGARYEPETLQVRYRGKSIADVLNLRVKEAMVLFESIPRVRKLLQTLDDVGLGYLQLGQPAPTLSAGEAQRVKLAAELGRPQTGKTLYILDEPTTGLHFDDLRKLLVVLHRLVDLGNTCICIEHNLDVIKTADWIIDLGPEAGAEGGTIVAEGTPEDVAKVPASHTGRALAPVLAAGPREHRVAHVPSEAERFPKEEAEPIVLDGEARMPWERDGRGWHTKNPVDREGRPVAWDPALLTWIVETIESGDGRLRVHWNHPSRVEITAMTGKWWFCHILTRGRELLDLAVRVPAGVLRLTRVRAELAIPTLDERTDLPVYGQEDRVRMRSLRDGWEEYRLHLRDFKDVRRPALRRFLRQAAGAYMGEIERMCEQPAQQKPWLADGKAWHLSQKSIRRGARVRWKPAALMALIGRFKSIQADLDVAWNRQTAVELLVPGEEKYAGRIVTNQARGLRVELRAPSALLTPVMVDRLGTDARIKSRGGWDWVVFWVRSLTDNDPVQLADVWRRCRRVASEGRLQSA
ncbi:MAG: excinuclease ABC subunit UvrA [Planctomycetota bacterium]|nr:MAG: excinuclease ABC subunit UvrA [Planctomycetota bacterium]